MKDIINFGGFHIKPGEKASGFAPVYQAEANFPITIINGKNEGKTVVITAGIHGGEYPCLETAMELAQELDPLDISGQIIIIHPVNWEGFINRRAYVNPVDGKNINRLFPGNKNGTVSDKIAYTITTEYSDKADFYMDLHGGDICETLPPYVYYPGIGSANVIETSKKAASILNADFIVKSSATTGAYNSAGIRGIPSLLIECGGKGIWDNQTVAFYKNNVINILRLLGVIPGKVTIPEKQPYEITNAEYIDASNTGCWYPLVKLKDKVYKGQKIGIIKDVFGNIIEEIYANYDSIILFLTVSLAIKAGDPIITYGI